MMSNQSETLEEKKTFRRDGTLWIREFFKNGLREGKYMNWYPNGHQLWEQKFYRDGKQEGEYAKWYQNGRRREQSFYWNNGMEGEAKMWYADGSFYMKQFFLNRRQEGMRRTWYHDGEIRAQEYYIDDEAVDGNFTRTKKNGFLRLKRCLRNRIIYPLDMTLIRDLVKIAR
jgi:antitoxin component YwqK of YwqJK toxin-antitoxin module